MAFSTTWLTTALLLAAAPAAVQSADNGFGRTPVMGFNTYNDVNCKLSESYVQDAIRAFAQKGFKDAGYNIFSLDCGWQGLQRQSNGSITYDSSVFPNGITPLSKLANSLGFLWGMYTDQGVFACDSVQGRPGSLGHEKEDALQFAGWNTAYLKVDNCYITPGATAPKDPRTDFPSRFGAFWNALTSVGIKGMLICQWGTPYSGPNGLEGPATWTTDISTSYRVSDDIASGWKNVVRIYNQNIHVLLKGLSGPGHFSDMDLLEVGNSAMSVDEQASHFAIWAMFKSPLFVSTNIPRISDASLKILLNKDLIAINQDSAAKPVTLVQRFTDHDVFAGDLANGDKAVLLVETSNAARTLSVDFASLGIKSATVKNLWTGQTTTGQSSYSAQVNAHGSIPLRLSNVQTQAVSTPKLNWIEAESGALDGSAKKTSCAGCSGGSSVGSISQTSGSVTFSNIKTSQATQDVRLDYINCEVNYSFAGVGPNYLAASISVNGGAGVSVQLPLTGYNCGVDVLKNFLVRLSGFNTSGANTIKISGLSGNDGTKNAPIIDRIGVVA